MRKCQCFVTRSVSFEVGLRGFSAPKGQPYISPGQRPGSMETPKRESPERAEQDFDIVVPPFQGWNIMGALGPRAALVAKRHCALPWAFLFGPFGAKLWKSRNFKTYASGHEALHQSISRPKTPEKQKDCLGHSSLMSSNSFCFSSAESSRQSLPSSPAAIDQRKFKPQFGSRHLTN